MTDAARKAPSRQDVDTPWFETPEAAAYMRMSVRALQLAVWRGTITPDCRGGRGRTRSHRFRRETLDRFLEGR